MLDHQAFPHILESILKYADRPAFLRLRAVSRGMREYADSILFKHVAIMRLGIWYVALNPDTHGHLPLLRWTDDRCAPFRSAASDAQGEEGLQGTEDDRMKDTCTIDLLKSYIWPSVSNPPFPSIKRVRSANRENIAILGEEIRYLDLRFDYLPPSRNPSPHLSGQTWGDKKYTVHVWFNYQLHEWFGREIFALQTRLVNSGKDCNVVVVLHPDPTPGEGMYMMERWGVETMYLLLRAALVSATIVGLESCPARWLRLEEGATLDQRVQRLRLEANMPWHQIPNLTNFGAQFLTMEDWMTQVDRIESEVPSQLVENW
jgi:hypothetical protein